MLEKVSICQKCPKPDQYIHILLLGCKNQKGFLLGVGQEFRKKVFNQCFECTCKRNTWRGRYSFCQLIRKCIPLDCKHGRLFTPAGRCCPICSKCFMIFPVRTTLLLCSLYLILISGQSSFPVNMENMNTLKCDQQHLSSYHTEYSV